MVVLKYIPNIAIDQMRKPKPSAIRTIPIAKMYRFLTPRSFTRGMEVTIAAKNGDNVIAKIL